MDDKTTRPAGTTIGAYEAKSKFSELIARTEKGESFVVTRNGRPVARITPIASDRQLEAKAAGQRLVARFDARARGEFDFDAFWAELKQEDDEQADRWL